MLFWVDGAEGGISHFIIRPFRGGFLIMVVKRPGEYEK